MCCGQKRASIRQQQQIISAVRHPMPTATPAAHAAQRLAPVVFQGRGSYLATGHHSREVYHFSSSSPEQLVDARDIEALVGSGFFRPKEPS